MSKFIWEPAKEIVENANVKKIMQKAGTEDPWELHKRSVEDIEWFWKEVEEELGIHWFTPYEKVLDISQGIQWAKWFVGGKTNIAYNCVDKHINDEKARNRVAVIWEGEDGEVRKLTYWELYQQSRKVAEFLLETGVKEGDAVGVYMPMVPEIVSVIMGIARIGAVFVPVFSGYGAGAVKTRIKDAEAKVLFTADGFFRRGKVVRMKETADEAVEGVDSIKKVVVYPRLGIKVPFNSNRDVGWDEIENRKGNVDAVPLDSESTFMIIYTSGTTGRPKGAVHVHGGFNVKIAQEVYHSFDLKEDDILFWFTDMGWIMGPWEVVGTLTLGGTIFLYEGAPDYPHPGRIWEVLEKHGITIFGFSPTGVRAMMKYEEEVEKYNLSRLRILGSTGEPWNPEPYRWFFEKVGGGRCPIINISGGTEVGACFLAPLPVIPLKVCSLGMPALGMDVDVFNEDGKPVRGEVGELVCKQPWPGMTRGLYRDPERYIQTYWSRWENVWVHGDWASIDEDGYWFLHGRSDDTIKVAGKRVGPAEVESALTSHPAVQEAAAVGVPDELKGEKIVCFAILRPSYTPSDELEKELKEKCAEILGKAIQPSRVFFVKDLPRTRNAKILRRVVKKVYLGEDPGDLSSLENPSAVEEIKKLREVTGEGG